MDYLDRRRFDYTKVNKKNYKIFYKHLVHTNDKLIL